MTAGASTTGEQSLRGNQQKKHDGIESDPAAILPSLDRIQPGFTQPKNPHHLLHVFQTLLPTVLATFLCAVFVAITPIASLSGTKSYSFLILVILILYFYPGRNTIGKHIQITIVGICGVIIGLGWSLLATELACIVNRAHDRITAAARSIPAIFLALISLGGGYLNSRYPRLGTGCLLAIFVSIWSLSESETAFTIDQARFLGLLYSATFAAGLSLIVVLVTFPLTASSLLSQTLIDTLGTTSELLLASLHLYQLFDSASEEGYALHQERLRTARELRSRVLYLRQTLASQAMQLRPMYEEAKYEITIAYSPVTDYAVLIELVTTLQSALTSRMGLDTDLEDFELRRRHAPDFLRQLVNQLGILGLENLDGIREKLAEVSLLQSPTLILRERTWKVKEEVASAASTKEGDGRRAFGQRSIEYLVEKFTSAIVQALEEALLTSQSADSPSSTSEGKAAEKDSEPHASVDAETGSHDSLEAGLIGHHRLFRENTFKDCLFFTSLIDLSRNISHGSLLANALPGPSTPSQQATPNKGEHGPSEARRSLWLPQFSMAFLRSESSGFQDQADDDHAHEGSDPETHSTFAIKEPEAPVQHAYAHLQPRTPSYISDHEVAQPQFMFSLSSVSPFLQRRRVAFQKWWDGHKMLRRRMILSRLLRTLKRSRHIRHGIKCALGISLLTLPGHLSSGTDGYKWFKGANGPWIAISYLYCLQTTVAATYRVAVFRTIGTFLGAFYALACQKISHNDPYALVVLMTLQSLFTGYLILLKPRFAGIGTVASLTVPPILFSSYLRINQNTIVKLAFLRAQDIEIGIVAAVIVNGLLWPYHARVHLVKTLAEASDRLIKLYLSMSKHILQRNPALTADTIKRYERLETRIRSDISRASILCNLLHLETSLLPKPIRKFAKLSASLDVLLDLFSGLRSIRQYIPRQMTVTDVLTQRTEMVSSILITLHAISHSLHSRVPIPQFLPSPRMALDNLILAVESHIEDTLVPAFTLAANFPELNAPTDGPDGKDLASPRSSSGGEAKERVSARHLRFSEDGAAVASSSPSSPTALRQFPSMSSPPKLDFSLAFALAENEVMIEVVQILEEILELCKRLHGTASFIVQDDSTHLLDMESVRGHLTSHTHTPARSRRNSGVTARTRSRHQSLQPTGRPTNLDPHTRQATMADAPGDFGTKSGDRSQKPEDLRAGLEPSEYVSDTIWRAR